MPIVGLYSYTNYYMFTAIKNIVDEPVYDGRFSNCLVSQKCDFILEQRRNGTLTQVEITHVSHFVEIYNIQT